MSGMRVPNKEEIRDFLGQMGGLDMRLIQNRRHLGNSAVAHLGFVEAMCVAGELDASAHAKGQAAAGIVVDIIIEMQEGLGSETRLAYLLAEHCVKGRKLEIVGQEIGYGRSQSYRLRKKALMQIQERLAELERNHFLDGACSLRGIKLLSEKESQIKAFDDKCQFFEQIIVWIQTKCMTCDGCSLAVALA